MCLSFFFFFQWRVHCDMNRQTNGASSAVQKSLLLDYSGLLLLYALITLPSIARPKSPLGSTLHFILYQKSFDYRIKRIIQSQKKMLEQKNPPHRLHDSRVFAVLGNFSCPDVTASSPCVPLAALSKGTVIFPWRICLWQIKRWSPAQSAQLLELSVQQKFYPNKVIVAY